MSEELLQALSSSFTPQQRDYLAAYIEKKIEERAGEIIRSAKFIDETYNALVDQVGSLQSQVSAYEAKFFDDGKYELTRAKIVAFLLKEGIE